MRNKKNLKKKGNASRKSPVKPKAERKIISRSAEITLIILLPLLIAIAIIFAGKTDQETESFIKLAQFVEENTKESQPLSENLASITEKLFTDMEIADQINPGMGNAYGRTYILFQSAYVLGLRDFRLVKRTTLDGAMASREAGYYFAELNVDGQWQLFDPTVFKYRKKDGRVLSLNELAEDPEMQDTPFLQMVFRQPLDDPDFFYIWKLYQIKVPKPLGIFGFQVFQAVGETPAKLLILLRDKLSLWLITVSLMLSLMFLFKVKFREINPIPQTVLAALACILVSSFVLSFALKRDTETRQFLFNAGILERVVENQPSQSDKMKAITDWLHENIQHGEYYPAMKLTNATESIKAGYGNCGIQGRNVIELAGYLGHKEHRLIRSKNPEHVVTEIKVNGRWELYDADSWKYVERNGRVLSLQEISRSYKKIEKLKEKVFFNKETLGQLQYYSVKQPKLYPEIPVGEFFTIYSWLGKHITAMLILFIKNPWEVFAFAIAMFCFWLRLSGRRWMIFLPGFNRLAAK